MFYVGKFYLKLLRIDPEETSFLRRGFHVTNKTEYLETIGKKFLLGYHSALLSRDLYDLEDELNDVSSLYRGFAFEGAAMALSLRDTLVPFRNKLLPEFLCGAARDHIYTAHVGVGWALARIPWLRGRIAHNISAYDPLLKWLIVDGYGFHEGYFNPNKYFRTDITLGSFTGYARNAFTQGLGRSLWFVEGADTKKIPRSVGALPKLLHSDLWSGVGLACGYAGGINEEEISRLKVASGCFLPYLAQGVAFAARARQRAGNPSLDTEAACRVICHCTADEAALVTDNALEDLEAESSIPSYEVWRRRIMDSFVALPSRNNI